MKIVALSDTHGKHRKINPDNIPDGDVLIHAGDFTKHGDLHELEDFLDWFKTFPHKHKIFIAGNHDLCMQNHIHEPLPTNPAAQEKIEEMLNKYYFKENIIYLHNSSKTINGVRFFGSPYSNTLPGWAFNTDEEENSDVWEYIFDDTDVLITHGPPHGENDRLKKSGDVGCKQLKKKRDELNDLKLHIYGHTHEHNGKAEDKPWSRNVSILNTDYKITDKPEVINL